MDAARESGGTPRVSTISSLSVENEQADTGRDGRTCLAAGPNSQARTGTEKKHFLRSADHGQDWQPYPVDPYSAICDDHTYMHARENLVYLFMQYGAHDNVVAS